MAAITAGLVVAGAGAAYSARQARRGSSAQTRASRDAISAQQESEGRALEMQRPLYEAGYAATAAMMDMAGLDRSRMGSATRAADAEERGVMVGDTLLPEGTTTQHVENGWYNVMYDGQRIGTLRPGGKSGRFLNDSGFDIPGAFNSRAGAATANPADISSYARYDWQTDPGYEFRLNEGTRAIERSAAARGVLSSGGTIRSATRYAQDYASNEYQRVFDRIATIAGRGQASASQASQTIINTGQNVGNALINAGEARASGYVAQGNAWANFANQAGMAAGYANGGSNFPITTPGYGDPYGYYNGGAVRLS